MESSGRPLEICHHSPNHAEQVLGRHVSSKRRDAIHQDIRSFITEASAIRFSVQHKDLVLEITIDMIN